MQSPAQAGLLVENQSTNRVVCQDWRIWLKKI